MALTPYEILTSPDYEWSPPENLGPEVNSTGDEIHPCLSADGLSLLFESFRAGGQGFADLWECRRPSPTKPWSAPQNLGPKFNTSATETHPSLSPNGLTLAFSSDRAGTPPRISSLEVHAHFRECPLVASYENVRCAQRCGCERCRP